MVCSYCGTFRLGGDGMQRREFQTKTQQEKGTKEPEHMGVYLGSNLLSGDRINGQSEVKEDELQETQMLGMLI